MYGSIAFRIRKHWSYIEFHINPEIDPYDESSSKQYSAPSLHCANDLTLLQ